MELDQGLQRFSETIKSFPTLACNVFLPINITTVIVTFLLFLSFTSTSLAQMEHEEIVEELTSLSLEELMNYDVLTVEKRLKKVQNTPSAIYIITNEELKRSGATSIAEALRGVPGIQVSRIDSNLWAISSRGFNERYSNKLLVMIDGRTVYTPIFSGVYWDVQDTVLEDIDRIEVVRGPGSTIWGANAVNGVINVLTKDASKTQGWLLSQIIGNEDRIISTVRYGGKFNEDIYYRVYAKYTKRDGFVDMDGNENTDDWRTERTGFRLDWLPCGNGKLTLQGDLYAGRVHSREVIPVFYKPYSVDSRIKEHVSGANLLTRYNYSFSSNSSVVLQFYYDSVKRSQRFSIPDYHEDYRIDTADLDITHNFTFLNHHLTWGGGVRFISDHIDNNTHITFDPERDRQYIYNLFAQDEIELIKDVLYFTLGTKVEHNEYTDFEYEPSARLLWHPAPDNTIWASVSRAVRTPSRIEMDGRIDQKVLTTDSLPLPVLVSLISKDGFKSEDLLAYELGYRTTPLKNLYLDIALFYNEYDDLRSFEEGQPFFEATPVAHYTVPYYGENKLYGESYGGELFLKYKPARNWKLSFSYSYLQMQIHRKKHGTDSLSESLEGESPHNQFSIASYYDITPNLEFDAFLYYIDNLPAYDIKDNFMTNLRIGWRPDNNTELSLTVQNAFDDKHPEIGSRYVSSDTVQIQRSIYTKLTVRF